MTTWYTSRNGLRQGPIPTTELQSKIDAGELLPGDLVWTEGMAQWQPATCLEGVTWPGGTHLPQAAVPPPPGTTSYPQQSGKAIGSMISSIVGLMACLFIGQIIGLVLGYGARKEIRASGGRLTGEGFATAGIIIGWVGLAVDVFLVVILGGFMAIPFLMMLVPFLFFGT